MPNLPEKELTPHLSPEGIAVQTECGNGTFSQVILKRVATAEQIRLYGIQEARKAWEAGRDQEKGQYFGDGFSYHNTWETFDDWINSKEREGK